MTGPTTNSMMPARAPRAWQRMLSGRRLDLLAPDPADIDIRDIAHGLARVARWNGQTTGAHAFSVAQHALVVEDIAEVLNPSWGNDERLAALLHDSAEYVIGDLISPFKTAIGLDYKSFELRLMAAIHRAFGLPDALAGQVADAIKAADHVAAYFEATRLAGFGETEAAEFFGAPSGLPATLAGRLGGLTPMPPDVANRAFLARFQALARSG